jgi:hypothetical protein
MIRGSEVPMLVLFTTFLTGRHNEDVFSCCTSSLIVVCNAEAADKIVPSNSETQFAYKIPVHGKLKLYIVCQVKVAASNCFIINHFFMNLFTNVIINNISFKFIFLHQLSPIV